LGVLWLLNSDIGIKWLQSSLWKPVQRHGYKSINIAAHLHVMKQSLDFHECKEPQAILQDMDQGHPITSLVEKICFKLVPMLLDLCILCCYLYQRFGAYMALDVAFTTLFYLYVTAKLSKRATLPLRDYIRYYRKERSSGHSTIECWQLASVSSSKIVRTLSVNNYEVL
jgi:ABC-type transport system involved in Fe-S cluster assembly fused permease/ATPase subunit